MKSLLDYILEAEDATETSKDITFDFTSIENAEDTVKSLQELGTKHGIPVSVDGEKVTISFAADTLDKADGIIDVLQQAIDVVGKSTQRASNEQYAQRIQKLEKAMNQVHDFMDNVAAAGDSEDKVEDAKENENDEK